MKIIKALEDLLGDQFDVGYRYTAIVGTYDQFEEIVSEHFEDHADMGAVDACDFELVQELNAFQTVGIRWVTLANVRQQFDFVQGSFGVVFRTFDDLHGDESSDFTVPAQPNGGEVTCRGRE